MYEDYTTTIIHKTFEPLLHDGEWFMRQGERHASTANRRVFWWFVAPALGFVLLMAVS
jgi:hypothetical protein